MQVTLYKGFENFIEASSYKSSLEKLMRYVIYLINENNLQPSDLEIKILGNHLMEMVNRAEKNEQLEPIDQEIFSNITQKSLKISQKIIDYIKENIGPLSASEKYVLSIHFENMQSK